MQISRHHVGPRMTQMVIHGDTIYLCGQTAEGMEGAGARTRAILAKIDTLLSQGRQLEVEAAPGPDLAR